MGGCWASFIACVAALVFAAGCAADAAATHGANQPLPALDIYFDSSLSMTGYITANPAVRPLGDLAGLAQQFADANKMAIKGYCAGNDVGDFKGDISAWGTDAPYEKPPVPKCGNQKSRIDRALTAIRALPSGHLAVLVSDFWFDDKDYPGTQDVAIGGPMRVLLADRPVMMLGVKVPFSGAVYGFPGVGSYKGAKERVLVILLAGRQEQVTAFADALEASRSKSFAGMKRTLFRQAVTAFMPPPQPAGPGVHPRPGGGTTLQWSAAARKGAPGLLTADYDLEKLPLAGVSVWRGNILTATTADHKSAGVWKTYQLFGPTWKVLPGEKYKARFAFGTHIAKLPPGDYRITGQIGTDGHLPAQGDKAAAWMRDWSLPDDPGKPGFAKVKGLADLAAIMEQAVAHQKHWDNLSPKSRSRIDMNRLSAPPIAVAIAILSAAALAFGGNYLLTWFVNQDNYLVPDVFGKAADAGSTNPFADHAPQTTDNVANVRNELLSMLTSHYLIACGVAMIACLLWVGWYARARINDVPEGKAKGRPVWLGLLIVVVLAGAGAVLHARYLTSAGIQDIDGSGMSVAATILAGLPLVYFLVITRLVAPNEVGSAIPY